MADLGQLAGLLFKTVSDNSGNIASTITNTVSKVKKAATVQAIKSKYQPGQAMSAADNAALQGTQIKPPTNLPSTSLEAPKGTSYKFSELPVEGKLAVGQAQPDIGTRAQILTNVTGELLTKGANEVNKRVTNLINTTEEGSLKRRFLQTGQAITSTPLSQVGEGLAQISGGENINEQPQIVKGLTNVIFGGLGTTGGGAAFNAIINQPEVKPVADKAFGVLGAAKEGIRNLPVIKDLPEEAKSVIDVGVDLAAFEVLHKAIKAPFKTTEIMEVPHPQTGEMVKIAVPVDTAGWRAFKQDLVKQVNAIKTDPIKFLKEQQVGLSIKDASKDGFIEGLNKDNEFKPMTEAEAIAEADKGFMTAEKINERTRQLQQEQLTAKNKEQEVIANQNEKNLIFKNEQKTGLYQDFKIMLNPMKHLGEDLKNIWSKRNKDLAVANEKANLEYQKLEHLPIKNAKQIRDDFQAGKETPAREEIQKVADQLFEEANNRGIKVEKRQNYLPQYYANSLEEIQAAVSKMMEKNGVKPEIVKDYLEGGKLPTNISNMLKLSPSFSKERAFRTYAEAEQYGLTPKFEHPAQMFAQYRMDLEKTIANRNFVQDLKDKGELTTDRQPGSVPINVSFSEGEQLYAKPKVAKAFNEYFRDENNLGFVPTIIKGASKINKALMEIKLSGGVPMTNLNFFTIGQTVKDLTAGNLKVLGRSIVSNSDTATKGYFKANQEYINRMAEEGISLKNRTGNWDNVYDKLTTSSGLGKVAETGKNWFDKALNKKTFDNFMPMQTVATFKNAFEAAIEKGLSATEAQKLAGETTKAWNGIIEDWGRGKTTQDSVNALFFAPRFREGIVNLIANTVKSVTSDFKNPAFKMNRKFLAGTAISYVMYNLLNKQLTGNYMYENEPGKEFDLKIPYGDGEYAYVALLPSVLSFPRNMISGGIAVAQGDDKLAKQKFGSLMSMPVKLGTELWSNKDYFGNPIYTDGGGRETQLKEIAQYIGVDYNHPYLSEMYNQFVGPESKKKDTLQLMSALMELPLKFSNQKNIDKTSFYNALTKQQEDRSKQKEEVQKLYDNLQKMKAEGRIEEANKIVQELPDAEYELYSQIKSNIKAQNTKTLKVELYPVYEEIKKLKSDGNIAEAQARVDAMTDEEYKVYESLKKQFDTI